MDDNFSLVLRKGPQHLSAKASTCETVESITEQASKWKRNKLWLGGADVGTFEVYGEPEELKQKWQKWLGMDLLETSNSIPSWNGQIRRVELYTGSVGVARDMNTMCNRIRALYNSGTDSTSWTSWAQNTYSQAMYGVREAQFDQAVKDSAEADDAVANVLTFQSWPPKQTVGSFKQMGETKLKIFVAGYMHSLNNRYAPEGGDGWWSTNDICSTVLKAVITNSDYITSKSVATNDHKTGDDYSEGRRAGEIFKELLTWTNTSQSVFKGYIDNNRNFYYETDDLTPIFYIKGGRAFVDSGAAVEIAPRQIRPGVARVLDFPISGKDKNSVFADRRDVLIENITVNEHGVPLFQPRNAFINEYMAELASSGEDDPYSMTLGSFTVLSLLEQMGIEFGFTDTHRDKIVNFLYENYLLPYQN